VLPRRAFGHLRRRKDRDADAPAKYPTPLAQPGQPEKREQEYIRHGVRRYGPPFGPNGPGALESWHDAYQGRFAAHLHMVVAPTAKDGPAMTWVLDNLNTHWSLDVCRLSPRVRAPMDAKALERGSQRRASCVIPRLSRSSILRHPRLMAQPGRVMVQCLGTPFLKRGDFCSGEDFETQLCASLEGYNTHEAHPYRWTYTGQPLVRATPFSQTCPPTATGACLVQSPPSTL